MPFVQYLWLEVFVEKKLLSHLKTLKTVAMETKMCHVIKLWTSFQKKLNCSLLVQDGHGFFLKGEHCAPPWPQGIKKSLAWIGLMYVAIQLFSLILKTRISIVFFQVFPPERNFLWDNLACFGHHNTLRR